MAGAGARNGYKTTPHRFNSDSRHNAAVFLDFSAARASKASFLMKKSVAHVSAGARRNILEIPVLQAGKLGYGKHVRVV